MCYYHPMHFFLSPFATSKITLVRLYTYALVWKMADPSLNSLDRVIKLLNLVIAKHGDLSVLPTNHDILPHWVHSLWIAHKLYILARILTVKCPKNLFYTGNSFFNCKAKIKINLAFLYRILFHSFSLTARTCVIYKLKLRNKMLGQSSNLLMNLV